MDERTGVAVLGIGSLRCGPPTIAALANYHGERPLDLWLQDADPEHLDLMDRFARLCFEMTEATHRIVSTPDAEEAIGDRPLALILEPATLGQLLESTPRFCERLKEIPPLKMLVLGADNVDNAAFAAGVSPWPEGLSPSQMISMPHQVLRWIRTDEPPFDILKACTESPIKRWLDEYERAHWGQAGR